MKTGTYRIVRYKPDVFVDTHFAVGAIVQTGCCRVLFVRAQRLPTVAEVGGRRERACLSLILESLGYAADRFELVPDRVNISGHATLGPAYQAPERNPIAWVLATVLPRQNDETRPTPEG